MSILDVHANGVVDGLAARNRAFAGRHDVDQLTMLPSGKAIILTCVDPRVDPAVVMGVRLGEAAVIRNIGGRITPSAMRTLALLAAIARDGGTQPGAGWNLVIVHHTDCGIVRLTDYPEALAAELGTSPEALDRRAIMDPRASLAADLAAVHANPLIPPGLIVSGLLYDTHAGQLDTVIAPTVIGTRHHQTGTAAAPPVETASR